MVKNILDNKGIEYQYKELDSYGKAEANKIIEDAREKGFHSLPLIFRNGDLITFQQIR